MCDGLVVIWVRLVGGWGQIRLGLVHQGSAMTGAVWIVGIGICVFAITGQWIFDFDISARGSKELNQFRNTSSRKRKPPHALEHKRMDISYAVKKRVVGERQEFTDDGSHSGAPHI